MCGDLDDDGKLAFERELWSQFLAHAQQFLEYYRRHERAAEGSLPHYMNSLFADSLARVAHDLQATAPMSRYERLAAQPLVLARLAGFLAANLNLDGDPLRKTIEALMHGYAEPEQLQAADPLSEPA
jgi:hypothetical protein